MAKDVRATHAAVTDLTGIIEVWGHKLYMDNFFCSSDLCDNLVYGYIIGDVCRRASMSLISFL
jgi:hypothetical protein